MINYSLPGLYFSCISHIQGHLKHNFKQKLIWSVIYQTLFSYRLYGNDKKTVQFQNYPVFFRENYGILYYLKFTKNSYTYHKENVVWSVLQFMKLCLCNASWYFGLTRVLQTWVTFEETLTLWLKCIFRITSVF